MAHEKQERYSSLILVKLRKELKLKDGIVFNNDYEGDPLAGAVKIPVRDEEVAVSDYDTAAGTDLAVGSTTYKTIPITKDKAVNEIIDGYEAQTVPDNLVADRLDSASYSLANAIDRDGANVLLAGGTKMNVATVSADTAYGVMVDARTALSKANIPNDGRRYALVTPDFYALLLKSPEFIAASNLGDEVKQSGAIGAIAGFNLYEWNDSTTGLRAICGHPRYATRINAWKVPVSIKDLTNKFIGSSAVQGRIVYDHAILREKGVLLLFAPGKLTVTLTAGSASGKTAISASGGQESTPTYKYRILGNAERAVYGQADSGFTAIATAAEPKVNDVIEVVEIKDSKVIGAGYAVVTADAIKA